jgi:hypothetical protein
VRGWGGEGGHQAKHGLDTKKWPIVLDPSDPSQPI